MQSSCVQADVYRAMRDHAVAQWGQPPCSNSVQQGWANFTPGTNALWVAHLCDLVMLQRFKGVRMGKAQKSAMRSFQCALALLCWLALHLRVSCVMFGGHLPRRCLTAFQASGRRCAREHIMCL